MIIVLYFVSVPFKIQSTPGFSTFSSICVVLCCFVFSETLVYVYRYTVETEAVNK